MWCCSGKEEGRVSGSVVKLFLKFFGHVLLNGFDHGALYGIGA